MTTEIAAHINYLAQTKFYRQLQSLCVDEVNRKGNDSVLVFWRAFGLASEGKVNHAIQELHGLMGKRDVELAVTQALIHWHESVKRKDHQTIADLREALPQCQSRASDTTVLLTATFFWHIDELRSARKLVDQVLDHSPTHQEALVLKGMLAISGDGKSRREQEMRQNAETYFDQALSASDGGKKHLEALMGKAKLFLIMARYRESLELLNQAVVFYPNFVAAKTEKAKLLMMMGDWDQALDTADEILGIDKEQIEAWRIRAMYSLTRIYNPDKACASLEKLAKVIEDCEPENALLYLSISQPFARLAAGNESILKHTTHFLETAKKLNPDNIQVLNELGYQYSQRHKYERAMKCYDSAATVDGTDAVALYGQIYCLIQQGELERANEQLEFFSVVQESIGQTTELAFLNALVAWRKQNDGPAAVQNLELTIDLHVKALRDPPPSNTYDFFVRFNPAFLTEVAAEYMLHCGSEPIGPSEAPSKQLVRATKLLEKVVHQVPGLLPAHQSLAHAKYVANDMDSAVRVLDRCLELDPSSSLAHLLMTQIHIHRNDFRAADTSLGQAVAQNFEVRESALYRLLKAKLSYEKLDLDDAKMVLESALGMPGVREVTAGTSAAMRRFSNASNCGKTIPLSLSIRASVFIEYAKVLNELNLSNEASEVTADAMREFKGTSEEVRVIVANSEISLKKGDVKAALRMLNEVPESSPAFVKAHMVKADIYLNYRNNKQQYAKCYLELLEKNPSSRSYVLLGEAYMRINMPDEAIEAFERALQKNPSDSALARRIGKALVSTHDYARAVQYYITALGKQRNGTYTETQHKLLLDLGNLHLKLKQYDEGLKILKGNSDDESKSSEADFESMDPEVLPGKVKEFVLISEIYQGMGAPSSVVSALLKARAAQLSLLASVRSQGSDVVMRERKVMGDLCFRLAKHYESEHNSDRAISFYKEAQKHDDTNTQSMIALAELYLRLGQQDRCQQQCVALTRVDPKNEEAPMMLANLSFQKHDFKMAVHHFKQLLEVNPGNFLALSKLISLFYRAATLEEAPKYLSMAERANPRAKHDPGLFFCQGLYARYTNDVNLAINSFNQARKDSQWGQQALTNMVEIYLTPDNSNLWEEVDFEQEHLLETCNTAKSLLQEFQDKENIDFKILKCYVQMSSRGEQDIADACQELVQIANEEKEYVPALSALATALMMMKQTPKARNQLKRIAKLSYNADQADAFERCWMLLIDIYIGSGKYDLAQDLCKKCLQYNRSCARAWESMGVIMEKESAYKDAAEHYEQAWRCERKSSATIGFKLAFNYLKAQRYIEAIDVANEVIKQFPDYPKIKESVLDKARSLLRL